MKILLVNPLRSEPDSRDYNDGRFSLSGKRTYRFPPTSLVYLSGLISREHEVELMDECIEDVDFNRPCDLVLITAVTWQAQRAYHLADEFRKRGRMVVLGGVHASFLPDEALEHADAVVVGEAEEILGQVIEDARQGNLKRTYRAESFAMLDSPAIPRFELLKFGHYKGRTLQTSRGCPYHCTFCSVWKFNGRKNRFKPADAVIREVAALDASRAAQGVSSGTLFFVDDNFCISRERTRELLQHLIRYNREAATPIRRWMTQTSISVARDQEMMDLLYEAGCRGVFVGFESISHKALEAFDKTQCKADEYSELIEKLRAARLRVMPSFIIGSDAEDTAYFEELADFIKTHNFSYTLLNILTPYPGTGLFRQLESEGRILHRDWSKYDIKHVVFRPRRMTPIELQEGYLWLYQQISDWSVQYRALRHDFSPSIHEQQALRWKSKLAFLPFLLRTWSGHPGNRLRSVRHVLRMAASPHIHGSDYVYATDRLDFVRSLRRDTQDYIEKVLKPLENRTISRVEDGPEGDSLRATSLPA
jgi:radical SAM superfamily enzyme YgiQ (UPF0313 family)